MITDDHDLAALRHLLAGTEVPAASTGERDRLDTATAARLQHERYAEARTEARRARLGRVAGPATVLACLVAVAGLVLGAVGSGRPDDPQPRATEHPVAAESSAVVFLDRAARETERRDGVVGGVDDDQFVYVRSRTRTNEGRYGGSVELGATHEREIWLSQSRAPVRESGLIREFGQDWPIVSAGPGVPAGPNRPTYDWLATLPTDADELLREIESTITGDTGQEPDQQVFDRFGDIVREGLVPPQLQAALFRAVTRIPGVGIQRGAADALGREGVAISRTDETFHTRSTWIIDPESYEVLGVNDYLLQPRVLGDGTVLYDDPVLFGASAVVERGVVDAIGSAPGQQTA